MSTWINVYRYHLAKWIIYTVSPLGILAFIFLMDLALNAAIPPSAAGKDGVSGTLLGFFSSFGAIAGIYIFRMLPFGLALGVSRRSYYAGTTLFFLSLAAGYGLLFAVLAAIEGATGGWGMAMHFFRVPYILAGPWTLTWLTSFVGLTLWSAYGMWGGTIYQRWNYLGLLIFTAAQITVLLTAVLIITWTHAGPHVAHALTKLTPAGLTGLLALLTAALLAGGYTTIRHVTV